MIVFMILLFSSCSTKKNTFTRRAYHNLTSHYNGWWNGNESLKDGLLKLDDIVVDDYSKNLLVFNYGDKAQMSALFSDMDRAIEKGSVTALRHSMWFKNREHCNWIDDSYMLIGKANFYKQEYTSARQSFNFVISRYYYNTIKSEAQLWLAKTFIESGSFQKAETLLDEISLLFEDEQTSYVRNNLDLVYADLFLKSNQNKKAVPYLESALELPIKRKMLARISYILAQLYQEDEQFGIASEYYQKVIKLNTDYQMAFNAKINLAFLYTQNSKDGDALRKSLSKMLKDSKNKNYLDQIYFALAEIDLKDTDTLPAISNLRKAVKYSTQNKTQKAIASLKAADLLFKNKRFSLSNLYYDTALQVLPSKYENYNRITKEASIFENLSQQLSLVQEQDSLLALGRLSNTHLYVLVDSLIQVFIASEERQRDQEFAKQQSIAMGTQSSNIAETNPMESGKWYFYNAQARSMGYTAFIAKWGNRKLADNWRLSNKEAQNTSDLGITDEVEESEKMDENLAEEGSATNPKSRNYYLKDIPRNAEQIKNAEYKIANALYQAAFIYKEDLKDAKKALVVFEEFARRIEEHPYQLQVYFQLYQMYDEQTQAEEKNKYKNLIIAKFPDTDYAMLVQNPDYAVEIEKKQNYFNDQYKRSYQAFEKGQYLLAQHYANQALEKKEDHALKANFMFIKALSLAQTSVLDSLYTNLEKLVKSYPDAEITPQAKNILAQRGKVLDTFTGSAKETESTPNALLNEALSMYQAKPNSKHFMLIIIDTEKINSKAIQVRINDYNKKQAPNLKLESLNLDDQKQIIRIGEFDNQAKAMQYYRSFIADNYVFPDLLKNESKTFVISADNYPLFFNDKDIEKYELFFNKKFIN
ncbi:MAG: hypothetical protein JW857_11390 [Bacteroidales bacterium]|nr:hypothetical protein [Bacteroidales bacterium]